MKIHTPTAQATGNIGLFYICYQLALRDWNVLPTCRNAKGADIFIIKEKKRLGIQVKALSRQSTVPLGYGILDDSVDFWMVLMNVQNDARRKLYIIPQEDIERGMKECAGKNKNTYTDLVIWNAAKASGSINYWLGKNFLLSGQHAYADAWCSLEI